MKKKSFLPGVSGRSWLRETQMENKLTRQVFSLEQQGFTEFPDTTGMSKQERILALQEAKKEAAREIKARISDLHATKGEDADLRVKAALANLEGQELKEVQNILQKIKDAKSDPENVLNVGSLYSALWSKLDSVKYLASFGEEATIDIDYNPF